MSFANGVRRPAKNTVFSRSQKPYCWAGACILRPDKRKSFSNAFLRRLLTLVFIFFIGVILLPFAESMAFLLPELQPRDVPPAEFTHEKRVPFGFAPRADQQTYTPGEVPGESHSFAHLYANRTWHGFFGGKEEGDHPTIILLHGSGRSGRSMIDMWQTLAREQGLVLLAPDSFFSAGWHSVLDGPLFLNRLLEEAAWVYPVDSGNVFVFGHSGGGVFAHLLAEKTDGPWRAVAAHAGYRSPDRMFGRKGQLPALFMLGTADHAFATPPGLEAARRFAALGHETVFTSYRDHPHWYYAKAHQFNQRAWDFFQNYLQ